MGRDPKSQSKPTSNSVVKPILFVSELQSVGGGYSVQFFAQKTNAQVVPIDCVWSPTLPTTSDLRRKVDMRRYDLALAHFFMAVWDSNIAHAGAKK